MITGFCGETEAEHLETLAMMQQVRFDQAFMFAYSMRDKTHAARHYDDDVDETEKNRRLQEIIDVFRSNAIASNVASEHNRLRLVLVEGHSTRSTPSQPMLTGRTDGNKRVVFPDGEVLSLHQLLLSGAGVAGGGATDDTALRYVVDCVQNADSGTAGLPDAHGLLLSTLLTRGLHFDRSSNGWNSYSNSESVQRVSAHTGRYVLVQVLKADTTTLRGIAVAASTLTEWHALQGTVKQQH